MENINKPSNQKPRHPFIQALIELHDKLLAWQTKQWNGKPPQKAFSLQQSNDLAPIFHPPEEPELPIDIIPKSHKELTSWAHDPMNPASPESYGMKLSDGTYVGNVHPADPTLNPYQSY